MKLNAVKEMVNNEQGLGSIQNGFILLPNIKLMSFLYSALRPIKHGHSVLLVLNIVQHNNFGAFS